MRAFYPNGIGHGAVKSLQDGTSSPFGFSVTGADYGRLTFKPTAAGTYAFEVNVTGADGGPQFTVSISKAQALTLGTAVTGALADTGEVRSYFFQGTSGGVIAAAMRTDVRLGSDAHDISPALRLLGPTGQVLGRGGADDFTAGPLALPANGTYRIDVSTIPGYHTSSYKLRAAAVDNPAVVNPAGPATKTFGSIAAIGDHATTASAWRRATWSASRSTAPMRWGPLSSCSRRCPPSRSTSDPRT